MTIDTGDTVLHKPSGEKWSVACVIDGSLYWRGWPFGWAKVDDCDLIKKATPEQRHEILVAMSTTDGVRGDYARQCLQDAST